MTKTGSDSGYWVFHLLSRLIPSLTVKGYFSWQAVLSAIWARAIFFILTAVPHVLKLPCTGSIYYGFASRTGRERIIWQWYKKNRHLSICTLPFVHMLRWDSPPFQIMYHFSLLGGLEKLFQLHSWVAMEELQNIKALLISQRHWQGAWDPVTPFPCMGNPSKPVHYLLLFLGRSNFGIRLSRLLTLSETYILQIQEFSTIMFPE